MNYWGGNHDQFIYNSNNPTPLSFCILRYTLSFSSIIQRQLKSMYNGYIAIIGVSKKKKISRSNLVALGKCMQEIVSFFFSADSHSLFNW